MPASKEYLDALIEYLLGIQIHPLPLVYRADGSAYCTIEAARDLPLIPGRGETQRFQEVLMRFHKKSNSIVVIIRTNFGNDYWASFPYDLSLIANNRSEPKLEWDARRISLHVSLKRR